MAVEAQFASLDGTAFGNMEAQFKPDPNALARRSISHLQQERNRDTRTDSTFHRARSNEETKAINGEAEELDSRGRALAAAPPPKKPKTTILHAVPPAKTIQMTPLEEEMATSPNEEIMSAISGGSPSQPAFNNMPFHRRSISQASQASKNIHYSYFAYTGKQLLG